MIKPTFLIAIMCYATLIFANNINIDKKAGTVNFGDKIYNLNDSTLLLTPEKSTSPFIYNDALEAIEAINKSDATNITLLVSPSVYWLDNPDDPGICYPQKKGGSTPFAAEITCDTLSIIGLSENPEDVIFAVNRGQTQGAIGNYTMLHFKGKSLYTENMTYGNFCNIDLIYPLDTSLNRKKRNDAIVQAQLGICEGTDRLFASNCRFLSRLNLCPLTGARRSLYKDCYFECTDDALTGSAVYLDCNFTFYSGKPFYSTSQTGAVFLNCDIHSLVEGTQYLTKMPGTVTMIDTRITGDPSMELKWTPEASPVRCYQSNVTLNGNPVKIDSNRSELGIDITHSPLINAFKVKSKDQIFYNTPNLLSGNDGWDPLEMSPTINEIEKTTGQTLTSLPVTLRIISSSRQLEPEGDTLSLAASPRLWGDYPLPNDPVININWEYPDAVVLETNDLNAMVTSANHLPYEYEGIISATTAEGLIGATKIKIHPLLKEAPELLHSPSISLNQTLLKLDYSLKQEGNDESFIVWYRSSNPDGINGIPVRQGYGRGGSTYQLTEADRGYYLSASVSPKLSDTHQGEPSIAILNREITKEFTNSFKQENNLSTSFEEIPIIKGQLGKPGFWNFDTYKPADTNNHDWQPDENLSWYYGKGTDAATGIGIVQATRGARLSYTPTLSDCKTMRLSLVAEPCKGPGQGFGSATGQYMDICIKFDPVTLNGYALRIERTPDYDKAVTFTLVQYEDGNVTPISESVASNCYRNPCHISLEITDDYFTANASTDALPVESNNPNVKPFVNLSAPIEISSNNSSFTIQHTGTVGASATLLRDLNVIWE